MDTLTSNGCMSSHNSCKFRFWTRPELSANRPFYQTLQKEIYGPSWKVLLIFAESPGSKNFMGSDEILSITLSLMWKSTFVAVPLVDEKVRNLVGLKLILISFMLLLTFANKRAVDALLLVTNVRPVANARNTLFLWASSIPIFLFSFKC